MKDKPIIISARVFLRHPELAEDEIVSAIKNAYLMAERDSGTYVLVGVGTKNRELEIILKDKTECLLVFHAMKATTKVLAELGAKNKGQKGR